LYYWKTKTSHILSNAKKLWMTRITVPTTCIHCSLFWTLKKCKVSCIFAQHTNSGIFCCFVTSEKIFIILSNTFIFKSSLCHTSCTVRQGAKPEKVKDPLVSGTSESQNSSTGKLVWETQSNIFEQEWHNVVNKYTIRVTITEYIIRKIYLGDTKEWKVQ